MKTMKMLTAVLLAATLMLSACIGMADGLTPGTYTATKEGFQHCHVTVSVTVDEKAITDVQIVECTDNPITITKTPCEEIPAAIVANQTYNVDGVTGATMTSNAIKFAVKDCLDQAGGADAFSAPVAKPEIVAGEDVYTDILVIGGGGSGMIAAIEASVGEDASQESGLKVTLIEKAGFLGGSTSCSGGVRLYREDETGKYDEAWIEAAVEAEKADLAPYMQLEFNEALLRGKASVMYRTNKLLDDIGVNSMDSWGHKTFGPIDHEEPKWNGSYLTYVVNGYLPNTGIDLRLNTRAMSLLTDENGAVIGASVQDKTSAYNIYAKKVILATGGFARNPELIAEYAPEFTKSLFFCAGTNTGDGFIMAKEIGAQHLGNIMMGHIGADAIEGQRTDFSGAFYYDYGASKAIYLNLNGERFCNEAKSRYIIYHDVLKQPEQIAWGIVDSNSPSAQVLEDSTSQYVHKADTLEELAQQLGINVEGMKATIENYNAGVDKGVDEQFGNFAALLDRVDTAPYYAFIVRPVMMTSLVGLQVDGGCRVINTDGQVIENLFAAGDMVLGGNILSYYHDARGVGTAMYTGDLAGLTAKQEAMSE